MILELVALLCAGFFAGAAIYVSLVEQPARLECGASLAVTEFGASYRRGAAMQAPLAIAGCLAAIAAWFQGGAGAVLAGGLVLGAVVPFTLIAIAPTTKRLLAVGRARGSPEAAALLVRWGRLHAVRSVLGGLAFLLLGLHRAGIL
jgi:hypothetical protein